ncbi:MAG: hypothetical protein ABSG03_23600 [Bryobacteraceae bacterium]|jgi:hypothetical protein
MMKLVFYYGPGDMVSKIIRLLTHGPYSHVELQFTDGCRFFASGHGIYTGTHMICDRKVYAPNWDQVLIPATEEQEEAAERYIFHLIGFPFDFRGMVGFLLPFIDRRRKAKYCSSIVLDVLQQSLHMFPGVGLKTSPNGLHRLFVAEHALVISAPAPVDPASSLLVPGSDPPGDPRPATGAAATPPAEPTPQAAAVASEPAKQETKNLIQVP